MSETKEYSTPELIEFLDTNKPGLEWWLGKKGKAMLTQIKGIVEEQSLLREFLWINHGCPFPALYGDDGEMQCGKCRLDFKRQPVAELIDHIRGSRIEEMEQQAQPDEELVDALIDVGVNLANSKLVFGDIGIKNLQKAEAEIRKLLKGEK